MDLCSEPGCSGRATGRGLCNPCYQRHRRRGTLPPPREHTELRCSMERCDKPHEARGLCAMHYQRWRASGSAIRSAPTMEDRLWAKVDRSGGQDSCWPWLAATVSGNYGYFWADGMMRRAHRITYELLVGPIPDGLDLDHLCRNPNCVNPAHLEPVTHRTNVLRGVSSFAAKAKQATCAHGHPYTPETTGLRDGTRFCLTCRREYDRRRGPNRQRVAGVRTRSS